MSVARLLRLVDQRRGEQAGGEQAPARALVVVGRTTAQPVQMQRRALRVADRHEGRAGPRHQRQRDLADVRAEPAQHVDGADDGGAHLGIGLRAVRQLADHADAQAGHVTGQRGAVVRHAAARGERIARIRPGDEHERQRAILDGAAERPRRVERPGSAGCSRDARRRPHVGRWPATPHHEAGERTEPPVSSPSENEQSPAATATPEPADEPPGVVVGVPGIARLAVRVVDRAAEGELGQVQLAEQDAAGGGEARHHGGVVVGDVVGAGSASRPSSGSRAWRTDPSPRTEYRAGRRAARRASRRPPRAAPPPAPSRDTR